tara:strand:- start:532 stop:1041 length:510 start_codon:yes stop_codon:yes gene_type:complete
MLNYMRYEIINENIESINNSIEEFHTKFKKYAYYSLILLLFFLYILLINCDNKIESLEGFNENSEITNNEEQIVSKCTFKSILLNLIFIVIFSLIIFLVLLLIIGASILGPIDRGLFSFCQSLGCVTNTSFCTTLENFIMIHFDLIPFFMLVISIFSGIIYNIYDCTTG